jgi:hypothetical protein
MSSHLLVVSGVSTSGEREARMNSLLAKYSSTLIETQS